MFSIFKKCHFLELRLAQLALDPNNSPGWDVLEQVIMQSFEVE